VVSAPQSNLYFVLLAVVKIVLCELGQRAVVEFMLLAAIVAVGGGREVNVDSVRLTEAEVRDGAWELGRRGYRRRGRRSDG
jgi:hypothetical protein